MEIIKQAKDYRVIHRKIINTVDYGYGEYTELVDSFEVQIKYVIIWVTIKEFIHGDYDDDIEFCKNEAIELFNKIVNPYGKI